MLAGRQFGRIKTRRTIRVPKLIATQVLELAHRLDSGENFDLDTESKLTENDAIAKRKLYPAYRTIKIEVV